MRVEHGSSTPHRAVTGETLVAEVPELPRGHVRRPRLLQALRRGQHTPLVLVSAPAGTGKTSLVSEWIRELQVAAGQSGAATALVWLTFDESEDDLVDRVLDAIARVGPARLPSVAAGTARGDVVGAGEVLARQPQRVTVVVDGLELTSLSAARDLDMLLRHAAGRLRLVLVGRADPVLPLYRYRLQGQVTEVRIADLAFTDEEATRLLAADGVTLKAAHVHELNQRVQGWAAGLRFAGRAMAGLDDPAAAVAAVVSREGDIHEYLLGEVLDRQPTVLRRFLLDTSIPDALTVELATELGGVRAPRLLDELRRGSVFLEPVTDEPGTFRYFPFFRDLLRAQLAYESPERWRDLQTRTAALLRSGGHPEAALEHLGSTRAWDQVSLLLVEEHLLGRVVLDEPDSQVVRAAAQVPHDLTAPEAALVRAAVALRSADRWTAGEELTLAKAGASPTRGQASLEVGAAVLDGWRACLADRAGSAAALVELAEQALDRFDAESGRPADPGLRTLTALSRGVVSTRTGDLTTAQRCLTQVGADPSVPPGVRAWALGYAAMGDALQGRLARAARTATEATALSDKAGLALESRWPGADAAAACVALERYQLAAARDHLANAARSRALAGDPVARVLVEAVSAGLDRAGGNVHAAKVRLRSAAEVAARTDPWLAGGLVVEQATVEVATGQAERALRDLDRLADCDDAAVAVVEAAAYEQRGDDATAGELLARARRQDPPLRTQVSRLVVEAARESRRRAPVRARAALDESLRIAEPEGLRRPFREAPPAVQRLLANDPRLRAEHAWVARQAPVAPRANGHQGDLPRQRTSPEVVENLTPKELEVLAHLEELLTTEEIAEKMFVSVNTVRTHIRSILRKLGVNRRYAAVRKARDLGLLRAQV